MKIPKFKKKKEQKILAQLEKDRKDCWEELKVILGKYNLIISGVLQTFDNAILASAKLDRPPEKKEEPKLAKGNTVKEVEVKGEAPGSPTAVSKAVKEKEKK